MIRGVGGVSKECESSAGQGRRNYKIAGMAAESCNVQPDGKFNVHRCRTVNRDRELAVVVADCWWSSVTA